MNDLPDAFEQLAARVEMLERRVRALEYPAEARAEQAAAMPLSLTPPVAADEGLAFSGAGGAFSVLGKAMLGIAGAYLLRAFAEASLLPRQAIAAIAIVYAILWLAWAARAGAEAWFASVTYAATSALILGPMVWELTLRFRILPAAVAAAVLAGFVTVATALAWKRNLAAVLWVANATAALVAMTLSVATHELMPFLAVLLLMAGLSNYAAARNRERSVRPLAAAAADLAIWGMVFIYSGPASARADYPAFAATLLLTPGVLLFLMEGAGVAVRTAALKRTITVFDTAQTMIALLLMAVSILYFMPDAGQAVLGGLFLALAAASYGAVFVVFKGEPEGRNARVFSTWAVALFVAGSVLSMPAVWAGVCLGGGAIVATILGGRLRRPVLAFHGAVFLVAACSASGLLGYALQSLAGSLQGAPSWGVAAVSAAAALCYLAQWQQGKEGWGEQAVHLIVAALAIMAISSLLVQGLMSLAAMGVNPGAHHLAFVRTLTICATALGLAYAGAHWHRAELTRMGYAALVLVAAKLVFEDLRHGHLEFIAASIFLFAVTLIAVPRMARMRQPK